MLGRRALVRLALSLACVAAGARARAQPAPPETVASMPTKAGPEERKPAAGSGPQVQLLGRALITPGLSWARTPAGTVSSHEVASFSDSAIDLGVREVVAEGVSAGLGTGMFAGGSSYRDLFVHRLFAAIHTARFDVLAGRLRLPSRHVMFPTLRDDDVLSTSDVRNPFVVAPDSNATFFGTVAAAHASTGRLHGWVFAEDLDRGPDVRAPGVDRAGADLVWELDEDARLGRRGVDHLGIGARATALRGLGRRPILDVLASTIAHVRPRGSDLLEARAQAIWAQGVDSAVRPEIARELAFTGSLRYVAYAARAPRFQLATIVAARRSWFASGGVEASVVVNGFLRIGTGTDLGVQVQEVRRTGSLAEAYGPLAASGWLALVYTFDVRILNRIDERATLLQLEHAHLPP